MPRDTYAAILKELRAILKDIANLRKRGRDLRERVGKARDKAELEKIRKQLGL